MLRYGTAGLNCNMKIFGESVQSAADFMCWERHVEIKSTLK